jgi:hypothetical protein
MDTDSQVGSKKIKVHEGYDRLVAFDFYFLDFLASATRKNSGCSISKHTETHLSNHEAEFALEMGPTT